MIAEPERTKMAELMPGHFGSSFREFTYTNFSLQSYTLTIALNAV